MVVDTYLSLYPEPRPKAHAMTGTDHTDDTPPGVRLIADGGGDARTFEYPTKAEGIVTRDTGDGETDLIKVPISSTRADREGDKFATDALEDMAGQIKDQQPLVFDNHGLAGGFMDAIPYDARETIGAQVDAEVQEDGDGDHTLYAFVNPDGSHPEGQRLLEQVRDEGQPVKFSVGFGVTGYEERAEVEDDYEGDGRVFTSADLMETSRVGIPANPDASVDAAMAKDSRDSLPGYQMHPVYRAMLGDGDAATFSAKGATPDAERDDTDLADELQALRDDVDALASRVDDLATNDEGKGPCDDNGDCPEGEVCVDGECVPEDDVDGDDEEEDAADPDEVDALRSEIAEIREALDEGRGDPETSDTQTTEPNLTDDETPDGGDETKGETTDDTTDHEPLL